MIYTATYKTRFRQLGQLGSITTVVEAAELAYVEIISVKVDGYAYDIVYTDNPTTRQVLYQPWSGRLIFGAQHGKVTVFVIYQH